MGLCMEVADKVQDGGPWKLLGPVGQDPNIMRGPLIMLRRLQATGHRPPALSLEASYLLWPGSLCGWQGCRWHFPRFLHVGQKILLLLCSCFVTVCGPSLGPCWPSEELELLAATQSLCSEEPVLWLLRGQSQVEGLAFAATNRLVTSSQNTH